jgi:KUP system potassium uptake protein
VLWHWKPWQLVLAGVAFGGIELTFLAANLSKVLHGGWLPLLIALVVFTVMTTWRRGREIVGRNRAEQEGPLEDFVNDLYENPPHRVDGVAVFPHPGMDTTPLALRANVAVNEVLHHAVLIVSAKSANVPHVPPLDRFTTDDLGHPDDRIQYLCVTFGFSDEPDIPRALLQARAAKVLEPGISDVENARYFLSRGSLTRTSAPGMVRWRKSLFLFLAHNAADPAAYFGLPRDRTVTMGSAVDL